MRKSIIILIPLLFALCLPACNQAPQPRELISAAGRFSVITPVTLAEKVQPLETQGDQIELHIFSGQLGDTGYFVSYWDYPPGLVQPDKLEKMLDASRDRLGGQRRRQADPGREDHPYGEPGPGTGHRNRKPRGAGGAAA